MKRYIAFTSLTLAFCATAVAQEPSAGRVVVPARATTRPRVVDAQSTHGSIIVRAYEGKEVIVESRGRSRGGRRETYEGLRRIDLPRGFSVEEEDNVVQVRGGMGGDGDSEITILVPPNTSLRVRSTQGDVTVEGVRGEIEAKSNNGDVRLLNISGTALAESANGDIKVTMNQVTPEKPLAFSSNNGDVDVTLPADFRANVKIRSLHGSVYSDFELRLTGGGQPSTTTAGGGKDGKFRVVFDRTIYGTINGGGTEASFNTLNGKILIRKK